MGIVYRLYHSSHRNKGENFKCVRKIISMITREVKGSSERVSSFPLLINSEGSIICCIQSFLFSQFACGNCTLIMQISPFRQLFGSEWLGMWLCWWDFEGRCQKLLERVDLSVQICSQSAEVEIRGKLMKQLVDYEIESLSLNPYNVK